MLFPLLQKIEVTNKSVFDLLSKTTEYLQPNPGENHTMCCYGSFLHLNCFLGWGSSFMFPSAASRAKLNMLNTVSKIRGQVKTTGYPQTEGLLGDCMLRYGHELGEESVFGTCAVPCSQIAAHGFLMETKNKHS